VLTRETLWARRCVQLLNMLVGEIGCRDVRVFGIEGPGWLLPDFQSRWNDDTLRAELLTVARLLEEEKSVMGASAHLLAVGRLESA